MELEHTTTHHMQAGPRTQPYIRGLPLLEAEQVVEHFSPEEGLVLHPPDEGSLLVLTNLRVMSFVAGADHKETSLAPVDDLKGVSVKANNRGPKDMLQGPLLILLGIVVYFVIGYSLEQVAVAAVLGAAVALVGVLLFAKYMLWEEEGNILFQGGSVELGFPYKTTRASEDVYTLVNRFFDLKRANAPEVSGGAVLPGSYTRPYTNNSDDPYYNF